MAYDEMRGYLGILAHHVRDFDPQEIVGLARSGFPYAAWIAQLLNLPLGYLNLKSRGFVLESPLTERVVIIDDNTVSGESFLAVERFMAEEHPGLGYAFGVLYADWFTPSEVLGRILYGVRLPYFPTEVPGTLKRYRFGSRHRDEPPAGSEPPSASDSALLREAPTDRGAIAPGQGYIPPRRQGPA